MPSCCFLANLFIFAKENSVQKLFALDLHIWRPLIVAIIKLSILFEIKNTNNELPLNYTDCYLIRIIASKLTETAEDENSRIHLKLKKLPIPIQSLSIKIEY